ncbi:MAG: hypothetical protein KBA33_08480 [Cloacibacterium sp.]|jgi:uncharacterized protein YdcH (DUF465 family)|nr:hypothetical protein [Cloacibacterium sp.]
MKTPRSYRKFNPQKQKIQDLGNNNPRFKRVYSEYENLSDELWEMENGNYPNAVPDDFLYALQIQTYYLEEEIDEWLGDEKSNS